MEFLLKRKEVCSSAAGWVGRFDMPFQPTFPDSQDQASSNEEYSFRGWL